MGTSPYLVERVETRRGKPTQRGEFRRPLAGKPSHLHLMKFRRVRPWLKKEARGVHVESRKRENYLQGWKAVRDGNCQCCSSIEVRDGFPRERLLDWRYFDYLNCDLRIDCSLSLLRFCCDRYCH